MLEVELGKGESGFGSLSPDGRYLRVSKPPSINENEEFVEHSGVDVYELATGEQVHLDDDFWGWTAHSFAVLVSGQDVKVCHPTAATCETETGPRIDGEVKLAGDLYES